MLDLALLDLKEHKIRTILTALGIFIAITAIVSLGSISAGLNELVTSSTGMIGSDTIFVMHKFDFSEMMGPSGSMQLEDMTAEDIEYIRSVPGVKRVVPIIAKQFGGFYEVDALDMEHVDLFGLQIDCLA